MRRAGWPRPRTTVCRDPSPPFSLLSHPRTLPPRQYPNPDPTKRTTFAIRNVTFQNIVATQSTAAGQFLCDANAPCVVNLRNVTHVGGPAPKAWECTYAHGVATDVSPAPCLLP